MGAPFRLSDVAFAEGLARAEAHLENALLLLESRRVPQALVQASRPMIELMPRLSRDLWDQPEVATELNRAIGAIAAGIRRGTQPPSLRERLNSARSAIIHAVEKVVGPGCEDPAFLPSVVVALLQTASSAYREAGLHVRFDALAYVRRARSMAARTSEGLGALFDRLQDSIGALDPSDPDDVQRLVDEIATELNASTGALLSLDPAVSDYLDRIEELIADAEAAYAAGEAFRADKLAARAYVENFALVKDELAAADADAGLAVHESLTGLRLGMHAKAPVEEITEVASRGRSALTSLRRVT